MTTSELYNIVSQRLADKLPLYVPRIGDGESMMLSGDRQHIEWLMKRQLGYVPDDKQIEEIRQNLITAYSYADIIGLPENKREGLNEYWYRCYELLSGAIGKDILDSKQTVSNDFHNEWLTNGSLIKLMKAADYIVYVSGHMISKQIRELTGKEVYGCTISPEAAFFPDRSLLSHYPDQFISIKHWIPTFVTPGALFIYGAGVVGKIYGKWAAERGAVALDIGNCFDLMAGYKTRGAGRGAGVKDETYRL